MKTHTHTHTRIRRGIAAREGLNFNVNAWCHQIAVLPKLLRAFKKKREKKASGASHTKAEPNRELTVTPLGHPASAMNTEEGRAIKYGKQRARSHEEKLETITRPQRPFLLVRRTKGCVASIEKKTGPIWFGCLASLSLTAPHAAEIKKKIVLVARMKKAVPGPQDRT